MRCFYLSRILWQATGSGEPKWGTWHSLGRGLQPGMCENIYCVQVKISIAFPSTSRYCGIDHFPLVPYQGGKQRWLLYCCGAMKFLYVVICRHVIIPSASCRQNILKVWTSEVCAPGKRRDNALKLFRGSQMPNGLICELCEV